ncbi:MAG: heavy metal translocating P-type ATPase, partial [Lachnospiraceae bacterium]|nr:heavy metal translocating P-type ATPase [Lachnospiraceae bacterium]
HDHHDHDHHDHDHEGGCCGGHDHGHDHHDHDHDHHDHDHEGGCCGGHDHDHDHHDHHDHEGGCCGGHDHDHDHEGGCCGGHDHDHDHHDHDHHDHDHEGGCCSGHDHDHDHHDHDHDHEGSCCGGHDHDHDHEGGCCGGHDHGHDHHHHDHAHGAAAEGIAADDPSQAYCNDPSHPAGCRVGEHDYAVGQRRVFILEGLDCPNCAQKIEFAINKLDVVEQAVVTYANLQMRVAATEQKGLHELIQKTIDSVEAGITVIERKSGRKPKVEETNGVKKDPMKRSLMEIIIGALIFVVPFVASHAHLVNEGPSWASVLFVIAYIILGGKVLKTAASNIRRGQWFDENFLMAIATLGAFVLGVYSGTWEFDEAVGVMLFYRIGEYFEQKATAQSRSQIMNAVDMRPEVVNLVKGDDVEVIGAEEAVVGDIVMVRPGDRIPLDGVIVEGESRIDTSPVTGEPVPVKAGVGDSVISGCVNTSGVLKMRVEKPLEDSMVTRILDSVENAAASKPQIDRFITKFSRIYTPIVVLAALAVAIIPSLLALGGIRLPMVAAMHPELADYVQYWITTALTFLVISCPCALVLSVPLAFFAGIGAASKKNILFKGGIAIEGLKNVKSVVMDKTGTITEGNFVVQQVCQAPDKAYSENELLALAASAEMTSTHPIGTSIVAAAKEQGLDVVSPETMEELAGRGIKALCKGKEVLAGNRKLLEEAGVDLSAYVKEGFGTEVLLAIDGRYAGAVVIADTIKKDAPGAIKKIKSLGILTAMLTGDAKDSAEDVAKKTGIDEVHAKLMPQDKLAHLMQIREKHGNVMFVGDGINDAPVLAGADVGAAMGSGADAAIEAADVVFMTSAMDAIPEAIDIAKATNRKAWQNVWFALAIKIIVMILGLCGYANMWVAVFADTGVSMLCLLNSFLILKRK